MNILLINHYAGSPEMGMEFRPYYMAKEWQKLGHKVVIIAADYSHIRAKNPQVKRDFSTINYGGVEYLWIKTKKYSGNGIGRVLNIFDFTRKLYFRSSFLAKTYYPDLVIASSTYTTDNYIAKKIAKKANAKYVYEVHDLWPLSPIELGGMSTKHPFILLMQHAEDFAYKNADYVISMLPKTKEYMASRGLDLKKWYYVPNGFSKKQWTTSVALNIETDTQINKLKKQFDFLLAYTGTLGLANNIDILLDASPYLPNNVAIVLMGEGPDKKRLKNRIKNEELKACFVFDSIQKDEIPSFLSKMDILYIGLKSEPLFRFGISPNKMIDYMMAGKPVIQAINAGNNMVKDASCGISIQPDNSQAIVDAVIQLTSCSETELLKMGKNGQQYAFKHHDYQQLAKYFLDIVS